MLKQAKLVEYLGDKLSDEGLAHSVEMTIKAREAKIKGSI